MFPNPQDALPIPPSPSVEQYRKIAKELVQACRSDDPAAIRAVCAGWIQKLADLTADATRPDAARVERHVAQVETFARHTFARTTSGERGGPRPCALADAQLVIARVHGFRSWPRFIAHVDGLSRAGSPVSAFEAAVQAIVSGDVAALGRLLHEQPDLIRWRSGREHGATLLHYVSANGVEGYRQVSPNNIAQITRLLLDAGADVDAEAHVYGGRCTALGLVATSTPPAAAGVQREVMDVLLEHGARADRAGSAGHDHTLVHACLANGQPNAAEYLADRGAPLNLAGAAGLGRVDALQRFFTAPASRSTTDLADALSLASAYGRTRAVAFLLDRGVDVNMALTGHGDGHTALHVAAFHAQDEAVDLLLRRGARVDVIDRTWAGTPLMWALTGWSRQAAGGDPRFYTVVLRLVSAGAHVRPDILEWEQVRGDPRMLQALRVNDAR